MWTESMATSSSQSAWRISRRYKRRARTYVNLAQMAKWCGLQAISACPQLVGCLGSILGSHCTNQYLPQCAATATTKKYAKTLSTQCWRKQTGTALYHRDQGTQEAKEQLRNLQKEKREQFAHLIPVSERKRLHNKIDPSLQDYLEWLSINCEEYFAEEHHQPSSSSSWSPNILVELIFMVFELAKMASTQLAGR